jgi:hypothetical protein
VDHLHHRQEYEERVQEKSEFFSICFLHFVIQLAHCVMEEGQITINERKAKCLNFP